MRTIYLFLFILLFIQLFTDNSIAQSKLSIAVIKIKTINCDENYGYIIENSLSAKLLETGNFTIMDKTQMDRIAQKAGFTEFDNTDTGIVAQLGRVLKVDKIIVGTITAHNGFSLDIRSIDSIKASIDVIAAERLVKETELEKALQLIAEKIDRYYLGYGNISGYFELTANFGGLVPFGTYSRYLNAAPGGNISANFNKIASDFVGLSIFAGAYRFTPTDKRYKVFNQFPVAAGLFYTKHFQKNIFIRPSAYAGIMISKLEYDADGFDYNGKYEYKKQNFQNFCVLFRLETALYIYDRWMLTINTGYVHVYDASNPGKLFSADAGIKTLF